MANTLRIGASLDHVHALKRDKVVVYKIIVLSIPEYRVSISAASKFPI